MKLKDFMDVATGSYTVIVLVNGVYDEIIPMDFCLRYDVFRENKDKLLKLRDADVVKVEITEGDVNVLVKAVK